MVLSLRSREAMASIVRRSVLTQSGTDQVAEPSSKSAMRYVLAEAEERLECGPSYRHSTAPKPEGPRNTYIRLSVPTV